jgi:hypothetical protein
MSVIAPIHVGTITEVPVRFFKAPTQVPNLPWHAHDDLLRAIGLPRALRRHFQQMVQKAFGKDLKTIAATDGLVTIAPHYAAQGLLGAAADVGMAHDYETLYALQAADALKKLAGDLPLQAHLEFCLEAARNTLNPRGQGGAR